MTRSRRPALAQARERTSADCPSEGDGQRRTHRFPGPARTTVRADIAEGLRFLWRQRLLRRFAALVGAFNFAVNATTAVLVLYAVGPASAMRHGARRQRQAG